MARADLVTEHDDKHDDKHDVGRCVLCYRADRRGAAHCSRRVARAAVDRLSERFGAYGTREYLRQAEVVVATTVLCHSVAVVFGRTARKGISFAANF